MACHSMIGVWYEMAWHCRAMVWHYRGKIWYGMVGV